MLLEFRTVDIATTQVLLVVVARFLVPLIIDPFRGLVAKVQPVYPISHLSIQEKNTSPAAGRRLCGTMLTWKSWDGQALLAALEM